MKGMRRHERPPKREEPPRANGPVSAAAAAPWPFERVLCDWVPSRVVEVPRAPEGERRRTALWITHFRVPHSIAAEAGLDLDGEMTKAAFMEALGITIVGGRWHGRT